MEKEQAAFYLGALLYPKDMKRDKRSTRVKREVDRVYSSLYKYSHTKLNELVTVSAFRRFFRLFYQEGKDKDFM